MISYTTKVLISRLADATRRAILVLVDPDLVKMPESERQKIYKCLKELDSIYNEMNE